MRMSERKVLCFTGWKAAHDAKICDPEELQAEIDSFMQEYDKETNKEEKKQKELEGKPDEEGWVTVTRRLVFPE